MISELLKKEDIRALVNTWTRLIADMRQALAANDPEALALATKNGWNDANLAALAGLFDEAQVGFKHQQDGAYITPHEALNIVQTLMESAYLRAGMVKTSDEQGLVGAIPAMTDLSLKEEAKAAPGQGLFSSIFDDPNPLYITEGIKAVAWRMIHGRSDFQRTPPQFPLADRARLVIVGDWGTGIPRADAIARLMRQALDETADRERHAIHLGDIYFCGWPEESQGRFLDHWPVKAGEPIHSWCLNGNHDMYCGGHGLFEVVLRDSRFEQQVGCSYFMLENDAWQIFGLDSAYEEWSFSNGQSAWAEGERRRAGQKRGVLLSHHQPFSEYEKEPKMSVLAGDAQPILRAGLTAWLWGHEHRAAAYGPRKITFADGSSAALPFGCCLGNGGVPAHPTPSPGPNSGVLYAMMDFVRSGIEKFGLFGFGILDLDGSSAVLTLVDEHGNRPFSHRLA